MNKFSEFFLSFLKYTTILNILRKRMMVIAKIFPKLHAVKILVRPLYKNRRLRTRFDSQYVKAS